jgi:hypothetical protein
VSEATQRGTTNISTALLSRRIRRDSQPVVEPTVGRTALEPLPTRHTDSARSRLSPRWASPLKSSV